MYKINFDWEDPDTGERHLWIASNGITTDYVEIIHPQSVTSKILHIRLATWSEEGLVESGRIWSAFVDNPTKENYLAYLIYSTEEPAAVAQQGCTCSMDVIMVTGCKCGELERERKARA